MEASKPMRAVRSSLITLGITLVPLLSTLGCNMDPFLAASNGIAQYEEPNLILVPGGVVNAAGGNLILRRTDMSMDTILGTRGIGATYNANSGNWLWNFQSSYDGILYTDETGAEHDVSEIADGGAIPGTIWTKVDATTIQTKGGLAHSFDAEGRLAHLAWATQDFPRIQYTWSSASLDIEQCTALLVCSGVYSIALEPSGNPTLVTDSRTGRRAEFEYDGLDRLVGARDAAAVDAARPGFRYEYDEYEVSGTLLTAIVNSEGERVEYTYTEERRARSATQIGGGNSSHTFKYSLRNGQFLYPATYTNPLGGKIDFLFDAQRRLHQTTQIGSGEQTRYTWQGRRPSSRIEPAGETTLYTYAGDDLIEMTEPSGNVVAYTYEPAGLNFENTAARAIRRIEDSVGLLEERSYDELGRLANVANGEGEMRSFTYHLGSSVSSTTDPFGAAQGFPLYGLHGHWLTLDGATSDQRSFDPVGNALVASKVLEAGGVLLRSWDGNRQLASLQMGATDELHHVTTQSPISIVRRSDGGITRVARPGGGDHEFGYDALGRVVERREFVDGVWQTATAEYDAAGNLTARELPNGLRIEQTFDAYGRLIRRQALRDGVVEGTAEYTWAAGRVASYTDSIRAATELYSYDGAGRLVATVYGFGELRSQEYDLRSRLSGEIYTIPGSGVVADLGFAYDLADRRVQITDRQSSEVLVAHTYQNGKLERTDTANGLSRIRSYDAVSGHLEGFTTTDASAQLIETTTIQFSAEIGPPRQQIRTVTTTSLATTQEQYWLGLADGGLQNPDAVVGKRVFGWNDGGSSSETFAYDELGNRASDPTGNTFTYNTERNRLLAAFLAVSGETHTYGYDEAGFVSMRDGVPITWTATERVASHGADTFIWDLQDRLVAMTVGGISIEQGWFGGRVGGDPVAGTLGSLDLGAVSLVLGSGSRLYRHPDFRNNVRFTSDDVGQVVSHFQYAPYGLDSAYGSVADARSFVGGTEVGELMVLGARVYDPAVGRFLSQDPVFQYANQYVYTMGNPVWFSDPDGRDSTAMSPGMNAAARTALFIAAGLALAAVSTPAGAAAAAITFGIQGYFAAVAISEWLGTCGLGAEQALPILALWWYVRKRNRRKGGLA